MKLERLLQFHAHLGGANQLIGQGPFGTRQIVEVTGGTFEGPRLQGEVLTCGGDWILIDANGYGHLDVRVTFKTNDGAHLYCQYGGVLEMTDKVTQSLSSDSGTEFGDCYFMTQPRFETGDERYAWLNHLVCVGQGKLSAQGVIYDVYACLNDGDTLP